MATRPRSSLAVVLLFFICCVLPDLLGPHASGVPSSAAAQSDVYERSYSWPQVTHLTISNVNGDITIQPSRRRSLSVRATGASPESITDQVDGDHATITVKTSQQQTRCDFDVSAPRAVSLNLKNVVGKVTVRGIAGHISVESIDGDVTLSDVISPSVFVKVTTGNIIFSGDLKSEGSYDLQSMRGDIDVTLPVATPFNLIARSLSEHINIGEFVSRLDQATRGSKSLSGRYLSGGPRLTLTTYDGRIQLHKK